MNAKLKIDIKQGVIEVEGTEEFVTRIYGDFKERIVATPVESAKRVVDTSGKTSSGEEPADDKKRPASSRNRAGSAPSIVKDLDLAARNGDPSLKDFCAPFAPSSAKEWNLLFLYFVQKHERANPVTQDHIYTCYKTFGARPPAAFSQSLFDTARKSGWIEVSGLSDLRLTIVGENYVEHDFPKKEKVE